MTLEDVGADTGFSDSLFAGDLDTAATGLCEGIFVGKREAAGLREKAGLSDTKGTRDKAGLNDAAGLSDTKGARDAVAGLFDAGLLELPEAGLLEGVLVGVRVAPGLFVVSGLRVGPDVGAVVATPEYKKERKQIDENNRATIIFFFIYRVQTNGNKF